MANIAGLYVRGSEVACLHQTGHRAQKLGREHLELYGVSPLVYKIYPALAHLASHIIIFGFGVPGNMMVGVFGMGIRVRQGLSQQKPVQLQFSKPIEQRPGSSGQQLDNWRMTQQESVT